MSDDLETRERLERLERSNRRMKSAIALILVSAAVAVSMGVTQPSRRTIEANEFVLRDPGGHVRATLSADSLGDAALVFLGDSRKTKGIFAADRLVFSDGVGNARMALRPSSEGGTIVLGDGGAVGLELSSDSREAGLYITTEHAEDSLVASISKNNDKNTPQLQNGPAIKLTDANGFSTSIGRAVTLGKPITSAASVRMEKDGKVIWTAP